MLLIKAMQEQQETIVTLQDRIAKLESDHSAVSNNFIKQSSNDIMSGVSLEQNRPNPFSQTTNIRYHVPQNANAMITFYNNNGVAVKTIKANDTGMATIRAMN